MSPRRNSTAALEKSTPVLCVPDALEALERALAGKNDERVVRAAVVLADVLRRAVDAASADIRAAVTGPAP
jgi:hypothetical protein